MVPKFFVGVDISKLTLDIAILHANNPPETFKIRNSEQGLKDFLLMLRKAYPFKRPEIAFCAEHMGIYSTFLLSVLSKKKLTVYLESPLRIKRSLGIQRGKNDKLDAIRIAEYLRKHYAKMEEWAPIRKCVKELQTLFTMRKRLLKVKVMLTVVEKDNRYYLSKKDLENMTGYYSETLDSVLLDIRSVEKQMFLLIKNDPEMLRLFVLMTAIPRIGPIIAIQMIILTNEFRYFESSKKFASYAGIAPFTYTSGTSLMGKAKVSHLANKDIKASLHLAAIGYVRLPETSLGKYYLRKVAEGKNKMSILNAMRNKIVHRIFACVRNGAFYKD